MRVLLVDDNRLMLEGLQNLLEAHDIEIAGMASDGLKAVPLARTIKPDVILMDIRMPGGDGLTATRLIKAEMPAMKIIVLTTSTEDEDLFEAVKSGAYGYLLKSMDADELVEALEQVMQGIPPFSPGLATKLLNEFSRMAIVENDVPPTGSPRQTRPESQMMLTVRQAEVLDLVAQGLSYKEVGAKLSLSPRTVKYHMVEVMHKLHLQNRAQVIAYATRLSSKDH